MDARLGAESSQERLEVAQKSISHPGGYDVESTRLSGKIGVNIRGYRLERGRSQAMRAELLGLNRSYIGAVEHSGRNIGMDRLERLTQDLDVPPVRLLEPSLAPKADPKTRDQWNTAASSGGVLSEKGFFEFLKRCTARRPDLVTICLDRSAPALSGSAHVR